MIISDKDSQEVIFNNFAQAKRYHKKTNGYYIVSFKIKRKKYYIVTYE